MTIEHVGICSNDTELMKNWYQKVFGFQVAIKIDGDRPTYFLDVGDGEMIEFYPCNTKGTAPDNRDQGVRHIAFLTDDIDAEYKNLENNGVEIIDELTMMGQGPVRTIYFRDAEKNIMHFIQRY